MDENKIDEVDQTVEVEVNEVNTENVDVVEEQPAQVDNDDNKEKEVVVEEVAEEKPKVPTSVMANLYINHAGVILFNLAIVAAVFGLVTFFSFMFPVFYYIVLLAIVVITFGLVFVRIPNFGSWFSWGGEASLKIMDFADRAFPIFAGIAIGLFALTIALLLINKNKRDWKRITIAIVIAVVSVLGIVIDILGAL